MSKIVKLFVVLFILVGAGVWFVQGKMAEDPGFAIAMAYGYPDDDTIELHVMVSLGMVRHQPVDVDDNGQWMWDEWVAAHFDMRDAAGDPVPLTRVAQSQLIPDHKARGVPEFYLKVRLEKGEQYTLDYTPRQMETTKYRRTFVVPTEETECHRHLFLPPGQAPQAEQ